MKKTLSIVLCSLLLAGCNSQVPPGHIGKVRTVSGFNADPLGPGLHSCWGRDKMYLLEVSDKQYNVPMSVLCKDQLNFKFNIGVLVAVDKTKLKEINAAFENVTPEGDSTITADQLFKMYILPVVDQEARKVVSRYETREIATNREAVMTGVLASVNSAIKTSIMTVKRVTVNNLDFPDVITRAQEIRAQRQVEVQTMKAETERQMEKARGQLKVAQLEYERELIEAAMIADSNKIIGASITPGFLAWHELKVLGKAASGPNNWGFIPYSNNAQKLLANPARLQQLTIDDELLKRIRDARQSANKRNEKPDTSPVVETSASTDK